MKRFLLLALFVALAPSTALAASLSLGGPTNAVVGDTVSVPVILSTAAGESANAVSATVSFDSQLSLVSISKAGSIISLWPVDPSQTGSSAHFEGIVLNPGYSGSGATVVTLTFLAKSAGTAQLSFSDASILANDGNATPILTGAGPKSIVISAPAKPTPTPIPVKLKPVKPVATTTLATTTACLAPAVTANAAFALGWEGWLALFVLILLLIKYIPNLFGYELILRRRKRTNRP